MTKNQLLTELTVQGLPTAPINTIMIAAESSPGLREFATSSEVLVAARSGVDLRGIRRILVELATAAVDEKDL